MEIIKYFDEANRSVALDAYLRKFGKRWSLSGKLETYNNAKVARCESASPDERKEAANKVYHTVWCDWAAGEGASGAHWLPNDLLVFFEENGRQLAFECLSEPSVLEAVDFQNTLRQLLTELYAVKQNKAHYPWVAVSKFLHVSNPALFPIYDITHVWNKAISIDRGKRGVFANDYASFCSTHGCKPNDYSAEFNLTYARFASAIMQEVSESFMPWFANWLRQQLHGCLDPQNVLADVERFYATGFEMILLGATYQNL